MDRKYIINLLIREEKRKQEQLYKYKKYIYKSYEIKAQKVLVVG